MLTFKHIKLPSVSSLIPNEDKIDWDDPIAGEIQTYINEGEPAWEGAIRGLKRGRGKLVLKNSLFLRTSKKIATCKIFDMKYNCEMEIQACSHKDPEGDLTCPNTGA